MLLINKTMLDLSKGLRRYIICIALLKVAVLAATAQFAQNISAFMGNMLAPSMSAADLKGAILSAFFAAAIMLIGELVIGEIEFRCTAKSRILLREKIFSKMLELDEGNIEKIGATRAVTDAVDGVESMQIYYLKYLPGLLYSLLAPIYLFFRLKDVSFKVALLLFTVSFIIMPINNVFRKMIDTLKKEYWGSFSDLTAYYLESLRSLTTIKLFNQEGNRFETLKTKAYNFKSIIMKTMKMNFSSFLLTDTMIYASVFIDYDLRRSCKGQFKSFRGTYGAYAVLQLFHGCSLFDERNPSGFDGGCGGIECCGKDKIGVMGASGIGKSTIIRLLLRFWDVTSGEILINGINIKDISLYSLRSHIALLEQDTFIFNDTIANNIAFGKPTATLDQIKVAAKRAGLAEFIETLPNKYDTDMGELGSRLSGGERQRVGIARVMLTNPDMLVMDEPTSALDIINEKGLLKTLDEEYKDKMIMIVSHRRSTLTDCNRILTVKDGKLTEKTL